MIVFAISHLSGNPVDLLMPQGAPPSERAAMIHDLGLDRPLPVQYVEFLGRAVHGDFGQSIRFHTPAMALVLDHMPATIELARCGLRPPMSARFDWLMPPRDFAMLRA